jgi:hypothetical protein
VVVAPTDSGAATVITPFGPGGCSSVTMIMVLPICKWACTPSLNGIVD